MGSSSSSIVCERVRAQISLALDGELSRLEQAMVASHLDRCAACRAYRADVSAFTEMVREAPLERMGRQVQVRRPRRALSWPLQAGAAAALLAVAAFGLSAELSSRGQGQERLTPLAPRVSFPPQEQLEAERALLEVVRPGAPLPPPGPVMPR